MFRRCDLEVETHHYVKDHYNAGVVAGVADANKQDAQKKEKQVAIDHEAFKKKSYEAGYRTEKELHKHNGIQRTIEESLAFNEESKKWDNKRWRAGFSAANEEDTRP